MNRSGNPVIRFSFRPLIYVKVEGEDVGCACPRRDNGFIERFHRFLEKELISTAVNTSQIQYAYTGKFEGFFTAENAAKIENWLLKKGAECE